MLTKGSKETTKKDCQYELTLNTVPKFYSSSRLGQEMFGFKYKFLVICGLPVKQDSWRATEYITLILYFETLQHLNSQVRVPVAWWPRCLPMISY